MTSTRAPRPPRWLALVLSLLVAPDALAERVEEVPNPRVRESWVSDVAGVIDDDREREINDIVSALERENGAEIAVATVRSADGHATPKDFAHALFNAWGVGKEGADNGVLILLVTGARRVEVETGYGAEGVLPDGRVGEILDRHAVPNFKRGDYGQGLSDAVTAFAVQLRKRENSVSRAVRRTGMPPFAVFFGIAVLLLFAVLLYFAWRSRQPPRCQECDLPMRELTNEQEKAYLDREQVFEESIGSVDHTVYRCDTCKEMRFKSKKRFASGYRDCKQCGRHTAVARSVVAKAPTYSSTGLRRVTITCRLPTCRFVEHDESIIPRKQRPQPASYSSSSSSSSWSSSSSSWSSSSSSWSSSSSSSSSFGGGSSGGGGAGRSW